MKAKQFGIYFVSFLTLFQYASIAASDHGHSVDGDTSHEKEQYHLFNPTPDHLMREMSADRPDSTESPITVDAGHVQVEASFFDYGYDGENGTEVDTWTFMATNVKLGLTNDVDIQFVFDAYINEQTETGGTSTAASDFGDLQVRLKVNLWGNDGGDSAFALFPYIKLPTDTKVSNDKLEGGLILPYAIELSDNVGLGLMPEIDFVYDSTDDNHDVEFLHSAVLGLSHFDPLGIYLEYVGISSSDNSANYQAMFSGGVTYGLDEDIVLDAGTRIGINDAAPDFGIFSGITFRY